MMIQARASEIFVIHQYLSYTHDLLFGLVLGVFTVDEFLGVLIIGIEFDCGLRKLRLRVLLVITSLF
jgi:hypothetical protein